MRKEPDLELRLKPGMPKLWNTHSRTGKRELERFWQIQLLVCFSCALQLSASLHRHNPGDTTTLIIIFLLLPVAFLLARFATARVLRFYKDGFTIYTAFAFLPGVTNLVRKERSWDELECVRFQNAAGLSELTVLAAGRGDCLVFDWRGNNNNVRDIISNTNYINLESLKASEREQLFLTLSQLVPQEVLAPEVLYLQVQSLSGSQTTDLQDYTRVWLEEYTRKFELSNYVNLSPGTVCGAGRFTITMTVAARINSSTYLAQSNDGSHKKVIIKELVAPLDSDDLMQKKLLEQFNREASILAKLNHPSIVSVLDHFIENGRSYIVMEQAEGRNMREYLRLHGQFQEREVLSIAVQLAEVLNYLHHYNPAILHRDFTPDNLIYSNDGRVTVIDFGAANVYNTGKTATLIGKQSYMPPEQLRGQPCPASDIYGLGATLSYLLIGKDLTSMGKLPSFADCNVSAELVVLLKECTAFEWENRPDAETLLKRLKLLQARESAKDIAKLVQR
jgi:tRNA A-37 threonylcarbamoyl transferase component Bud32